MSLAAALAILLTFARAAPVEAASARIAADGDCLNMRATPSLTANIVTCLSDRVLVTTVPGTVTADGLDWQQVRTGVGAGWVATRYLVVVPDGAVPPASSAAPTTPPLGGGSLAATPVTYEVPPTGGLTFGIAGTSSPDAVIAAQTFPVAGLSALDPVTQRYLTYIPGAPSFVNTLDSTTLRADMVVMVRRTGTLLPSDTSPVTAAGIAPSIGTPMKFATPRRDGLTLGIAGTNDVAAIVKAQLFAVDVVMALEVPTQRWLTYIPGAPDWVNTLNVSTLRPTSTLFLRRSATAPDPTPPVIMTPTTATPTIASPAAATSTSPTRSAPITYYYCTMTGAAGAGDGGGFCGKMSNGQVVHAGAASCDRAYFGQRFRVVGDPTNLVYTCMDTGGGVTAEHRDVWFATNDEGFAWRKMVAPSGTGTIEIVP